MPYVLTCAAEALGTSRNEKVIEPLIKLLENNTNSDVLSSAAVALGEIGPPAKFGLSYIDRLYEKERDYKKKYFLIRAMLKIDPTNRKYLTTMIEEILPHPFAALGNYYYTAIIKQGILKSIGEAAGKEAAGENLDFNGDKWKMLDWWEQYKKTPPQPNH